MGRWRNKKERFYCPRCGNKTLKKDTGWNEDAGAHLGIYVCEHNKPRDQYAREGRCDKYGNWQKFKELGDPCDCVIQVPGRAARIVDYFNILDLLIRGGELIKHQLLEKYPDIVRRGMQVLYSSDELDVVRLRDDSGVGIYLYWNCTVDPDRRRDEIRWRPLQSAAAGYINHRGTELNKIFRNKRRYCLWIKDGVEGGRQPFYGKLNKKLKTQMVEWAKALEANYKAYETQAISDDYAWTQWYQETKDEIKLRSCNVTIEAYDGELKEVQVNVVGWVTPEQAKLIAGVVGSR